MSGKILAMERKQKQILGFNVDLFSRREALNYIKEKMADSQGVHVVTINPEIIELANKTPDFAPVLKNADLIIPDGIGIKLALKVNGIIQEQIPGIEFAKELIRICSENNYPIALIGAREEILNKASANLKQEFNNLNIVYSHNGFFNDDEEKEIITKLNEFSPKLLLAALGAPKQDYFIKKIMDTLPDTVCVGVGGSFDVWSGEVQRAPLVFRKAGCEWLYRLLKQPSRFKRIFPTLPLFMIKVILEKNKKQ